MIMLFRSAFTVMFFTARDLPLGSHFINMGVNFIIIYFYIHVCE